MELQGVANNQNPLVQQAFQAQFGASFSGNLNLVTQERDRVEISFGAEQSLSYSGSRTQGADGEVVQQVSTVAAAASRYSLSVQGDLNEDELSAIRQLVDLVGPITGDFFSGQNFNLQEAATTLADNMGVVSSLALTLEKTVFASVSAQQVTRAPQPQVASPEAEVPQGLPDLANIRDFPALVRSVLDAEFSALSTRFQDQQNVLQSFQDFVEFIKSRLEIVAEGSSPASAQGTESEPEAVETESPETGTPETQSQPPLLAVA